MSTLNNATKARFMQRKSEYSTRASRRGVNLLGWDEDEHLSPQQEREALVAALHAIERQLTAMPRKSPERKALGVQKSKLQEQISAIRPKLKGPIGLESYFLEVCKEVLSKATYSRIMDKACALARAGAEQEISNDSV